MGHPDGTTGATGYWICVPMAHSILVPGLGGEFFPIRPHCPGRPFSCPPVGAIGTGTGHCFRPGCCSSRDFSPVAPLESRFFSRGTQLRFWYLGDPVRRANPREKCVTNAISPLCVVEKFQKKNISRNVSPCTTHSCIWILKIATFTRVTAPGGYSGYGCVRHLSFFDRFFAHHCAFN